MSTSPKISNNILAIDTAGKSLAVGINGLVDLWESADHHTDTLVNRIDRLLRKAKVAPAKLSGVVFVSGPGSFTGLRIGATVANGIGFVEKIGVVGITEFDRIEKTQPKLDWVILDAGRGELFVRKHGATAELVAIPKLKSLIKKADRVYVDSPELLAKVHSQVARAGTIVIGPTSQIEKVQVMMTTKVGKTYKQALPLYLREANITKSSSKKKV